MTGRLSAIADLAGSSDDDGNEIAFSTEPSTLEQEKLALTIEVRELRAKVQHEEREIAQLRAEFGISEEEDGSDSNKVNLDNEDGPTSDIIAALLGGNDEAIAEVGSSEKYPNSLDNAPEEGSDKSLSKMYRPDIHTPVSLEILDKLSVLRFEPKHTKRLLDQRTDYRFEGRCVWNNVQYFKFSVNMVISPDSQKVEKFDIQTCPVVESEIGSYLERCQKRANIYACLYGLNQYANIYVTRRLSFEKIAAILPAEDKLYKRSSRLVLQPKNGYQLILVWPITFKNSGNLMERPSSSVEVLVVASNHIIEADKTNTLSHTQDAFNALVEVFGVVEATIRLSIIIHDSHYIYELAERKLSFENFSSEKVQQNEV